MAGDGGLGRGVSIRGRTRDVRFPKVDGGMWYGGDGERRPKVNADGLFSF